MSKYLIGIGMIALTMIVYLLARKLNKTFPLPITLPILTATIMVIVFLVTFKIDYETYRLGGKWIEWLLGPGVVALAYPLYKQWELLKKNPLSILIGVVSGISLGITLIIVTLKWLGFDSSIILSFIPFNSTTPVAMDVSTALGGIPSLAAVFVMIAGIGGAVIGPTLLRLLKIHHFIGKGVGMGTASHAIGTSKIIEEGEKEGAASTVAMTISAVSISILSPIFVYFLL
jgi:predicted murein hydrolase (TIGR00659 family)